MGCDLSLGRRHNTIGTDASVSNQQGPYRNQASYHEGAGLCTCFPDCPFGQNPLHTRPALPCTPHLLLRILSPDAAEPAKFHIAVA